MCNMYTISAILYLNLGDVIVATVDLVSFLVRPPCHQVELLHAQ